MVFSAAKEDVLGRQIINRAVKPLGIIILGIRCHMPPGIFNGDIVGFPDFFLPERPLKPFQFSIALQMIRRSSHMSKSTRTDELFEILRDKLRPVVTDDPGKTPGNFSIAHHGDLNVIFPHAGAKLVVHNKSTRPIQNRNQKEDRTQDVHVHDIDMPVLMRPEWLLEAFLPRRSRRCPTLEQACIFQNPIGGRRAHHNDIDVQRDVRQTAVPFVESIATIVNDASPFFRQKPVAFAYPAVVAIGRFSAFVPVVIPAPADAEPGYQPTMRQSGKLKDPVNKPEDVVANIRFDPLAS